MTRMDAASSTQRYKWPRRSCRSDRDISTSYTVRVQTVLIVVMSCYVRAVRHDVYQPKLMIQYHWIHYRYVPSRHARVPHPSYPWVAHGRPSRRRVVVHHDHDEKEATEAVVKTISITHRHSTHRVIVTRIPRSNWQRRSHY